MAQDLPRHWSYCSTDCKEGAERVARAASEPAPPALWDTPEAFLAVFREAMNHRIPLDLVMEVMLRELKAGKAWVIRYYISMNTNPEIVTGDERGDKRVSDATAEAPFLTAQDLRQQRERLLREVELEQ